MGNPEPSHSYTDKSTIFRPREAQLEIAGSVSMGGLETKLPGRERSGSNINNWLQQQVRVLLSSYRSFDGRYFVDFLSGFFN
jgi:hypothetical protein